MKGADLPGAHDLSKVQVLMARPDDKSGQALTGQPLFFRPAKK